MRKIPQKHAEKLRFALVGGVNTALDFGILFLLVFFGLDKIVANFVSTSVAFVFSFFANKSFTFQSKTGNTRREFGLFIIITLFGLWILQPIVITSSLLLTDSMNVDQQIGLFIGKLLATVVTLIWNYILYSRVVFVVKPNDHNRQTNE